MPNCAQAFRQRGCDVAAFLGDQSREIGEDRVRDGLGPRFFDVGVSSSDGIEQVRRVSDPFESQSSAYWSVCQTTYVFGEVCEDMFAFVGRDLFAKDAEHSSYRSFGPSCRTCTGGTLDELLVGL